MQVESQSYIELWKRPCEARRCSEFYNMQHPTTGSAPWGPCRSIANSYFPALAVLGRPNFDSPRGLLGPESSETLTSKSESFEPNRNKHRL